jgi:two-component system phosphate regulon sensor histidine kinase PhoR
MKRKFDKQTILASLTFLALLLLTAIQVNYITRSARLEEQNFKHRVMMALNGTRSEMGRRVPSCNNMETYLCGGTCPTLIREKTKAEVDSIIRSNLNIYNIDLDYTFQITDSETTRQKARIFGPNCYLQSLNGLLQRNGIQLRLQFPDRNQFLLAQIGGLSALSILFISFVMVSFFLTQRLFRREKSQKQHTHDFINNMIHEFQTPLANVKLATNLITKSYNPGKNEKLKDYLGIISKENNKIQEHVEEILRVACDAKTDCSNEIVSIHKLVREISDSYKLKIKELNGSIDLSLLAQNDLIKCERVHVNMMVSNLLDNAIKYSGEKPQINLRTSNNNNNIIFEITDKGIGINKTNQSQIFNRYFRVSTGNIHNTKGFGLGLTFVKQVAENAGGKISVNSKPGKGSTFTIVLPNA